MSITFFSIFSFKRNFFPNLRHTALSKQCLFFEILPGIVKILNGGSSGVCFVIKSNGEM